MDHSPSYSSSPLGRRSVKCGPVPLLSSGMILEEVQRTYPAQAMQNMHQWPHINQSTYTKGVSLAL